MWTDRFGWTMSTAMGKRRVFSIVRIYHGVHTTAFMTKVSQSDAVGQSIIKSWTIVIGQQRQEDKKYSSSSQNHEIYCIKWSRSQLLHFSASMRSLICCICFFRHNDTYQSNSSEQNNTSNFNPGQLNQCNRYHILRTKYGYYPQLLYMQLVGKIELEFRS